MEGEQAADESNLEPAVYWARRGVSASRRVAYGAGVEEAARNNSDAVASADSEVTNPYGRWDSASEGAVADGRHPSPPSDEEEEGAHADAEPESRSIDREVAESEESGEDPSENSDGAEASSGSVTPSGQTTASSTPSRSGRREPPASRSDAGSHGWPVGLPDDDVATGSGSRAVVDPTAETEVYRLDDSEDRSAVIGRWGINPPSKEGTVAISGTFLEEIRQYDDYDDLDAEQLENQLAVVVPGENVTIYAGERRVTTREFPGSGELPEQLTSVRPVRAVDDDTIQLLALWREAPSEDEQEISYRIGILKPIGPYIGTIFERTVATRPSPEADLRRAGYLEFLRGSEHRLIRWTPADDAGEPATENAEVLEWNAWEGVYRVPKPPPTAPDQRS
jgi:hypothetical protein